MRCETPESPREKRIDALEKEYELSEADPENDDRIHELFCQLADLLGRGNLRLLREYTDRLIARFNKDPGWFYSRGYNDAHNE